MKLLAPKIFFESIVELLGFQAFENFFDFSFDFSIKSKVNFVSFLRGKRAPLALYHMQ